MTEGRAYLIPIGILVAIGVFLLWRNWAAVAGAVGGAGDYTGPAGTSDGKAPSTWDKIKGTLVPSHSFDPRKGSVANPAGYIYAPAKNIVSSVWGAFT